MKSLLQLLLLLALIAVGLVVADRLAMDGAWSERLGVSEYVERVWPREGAAEDAVPAETAPAATPGQTVIEGFATPESVVYDPAGDRYLVGNVGAFGPDNDGFIAAISPDGTVDLDFIRGGDGAPLNNALGTAVHDGRLYVADSPYVRVYDLATRTQIASHEIPSSGLLNDLAVAQDGAVYVTDMGSEDPDSWAVMMVAPDGAVSEFARGADLQRPNGIEIDSDGRVVLAAVAAPQIVILNDEGLVEQTISLPAGGYDGIVVLEDGYVVSNPFGNSIFRIGLDGSSAPVGGGIASPASLGYDTTRNRLLIPQLQANTVTLLDLD